MQQKRKRYLYYPLLFFVMLIAAVRVVNAEEGMLLQGNVKDSHTILLKWESEHVDNIYQIHKSDNGQLYSLFATFSGQEGTIQCYDYDVELGKTYYYKLVQISENDIVQESKVTGIRMTIATPEELKAKTTKSDAVSLTWKKADKATSYTIYRSTKEKKGYRKLTTVKKNAYVDYKVEKGNTYYYKITANLQNKKNCTSKKSEAVMIHIKAEAPFVTGIYHKGKIRLSWEKVNGADCYYIYKKNAKGKYKRIGKTSKLFYQDKNVQEKNVYTYKVIAYCKVNGKMKKGTPGLPYTIMASLFDPNQKMVALTFDDGPGKYTKDILKCLKENQSKATFFMLGCNIDGYEDVLREADKIGCELANHSYSHPNLTKLSRNDIAEQIKKTDEKIERITGKTPTLIRTPGGSHNELVETTVDKPMLLWSIDTRDWEHRDRDKTIRMVLDEVQDGDIVLMHDIYETSKDAACTLIVALRREGYQLVTVSELAAYRGYNLEKGKIYRNFRRKKITE